MMLPRHARSPGDCRGYGSCPLGLCWPPATTAKSAARTAQTGAAYDAAETPRRHARHHCWPRRQPAVGWMTAGLNCEGRRADANTGDPAAGWKHWDS